MNMKKLFLLAGCSFCIAIQAQQLPEFSQYLNNDYVLNPAIAGTKDYAPATISARSQWTNFSGAPNSQIGSIHGALTKNVGLGLAFVNYSAGPTKMNSVQFAYAYRTKLSEKLNISFGLAPMLIQNSIQKNKLTVDDANDNTFNRLYGKTLVADLNAGVYLYSDKFFASFSVPQIMENKFRMGDDLFTERLKRHYLLYGGYNYQLSDKYVLTPSILVKAMEGGAPVQADLNVKATYNQLFWVGLSYRGSTSQTYNDAGVIFLGIMKYNCVFGYSYDYSFGAIRSYNTGSHELFLTYRITCHKKKAEPAADPAPAETPATGN
jgi:type IX secretion system PorP/SprF family membrane protein